MIHTGLDEVISSYNVWYQQTVLVRRPRNEAPLCFLGELQTQSVVETQFQAYNATFDSCGVRLTALTTTTATSVAVTTLFPILRMQINLNISPRYSCARTWCYYVFSREWFSGLGEFQWSAMSGVVSTGNIGCEDRWSSLCAARTPFRIGSIHTNSFLCDMLVNENVAHLKQRLPTPLFQS